MDPAIIALRLVGPLLIFKSPFWGGLLSAVLDGIDWHLNSSNINYAAFDRLLDLYYLTIEVYMVRSWKSVFAKKIANVLFLVRFAGVLIFVLLGYRWVLFVLPNVFESFFLFYLAVWTVLKREAVLSKRWVFISVLVLLVPKMVQEYFMHIRQLLDWRYLEIPYLRIHYDNIYHHAAIVVLLILVTAFTHKYHKSR